MIWQTNVLPTIDIVGRSSGGKNVFMDGWYQFSVLTTMRPCFFVLFFFLFDSNQHYHVYFLASRTCAGWALYTFCVGWLIVRLCAGSVLNWQLVHCLLRLLGLALVLTMRPLNAWLVLLENGFMNGYSEKPFLTKKKHAHSDPLKHAWMHACRIVSIKTLSELHEIKWNISRVPVIRPSCSQLRACWLHQRLLSAADHSHSPSIGGLLKCDSIIQWSLLLQHCCTHYSAAVASEDLARPTLSASTCLLWFFQGGGVIWDTTGVLRLN